MCQIEKGNSKKEISLLLCSKAYFVKIVGPSYLPSSLLARSPFD